MNFQAILSCVPRLILRSTFQRFKTCWIGHRACRGCWEGSSSLYPKNLSISSRLMSSSWGWVEIGWGGHSSCLNYCIFGLSDAAILPWTLCWNTQWLFRNPWVDSNNFQYEKSHLGIASPLPLLPSNIPSTPVTLLWRSARLAGNLLCCRVSMLWRWGFRCCHPFPSAVRSFRCHWGSWYPTGISYSMWYHS